MAGFNPAIQAGLLSHHSWPWMAAVMLEAFRCVGGRDVIGNAPFIEMSAPLLTF
jgi:hypothetical protein